MTGARLSWLVAWYQSAEVYAGCDAEDGGDVDGKLLGSDGAGRGEATLY